MLTQCRSKKKRLVLPFEKSGTTVQFEKKVLFQIVFLNDDEGDKAIKTNNRLFIGGKSYAAKEKHSAVQSF